MIISPMDENLTRSSKNLSSEIEEEASQSPHPNVHTCLKDIPEEQSLRHLIRTRFPNGMPEDYIAIILRDILNGLSHIHQTWKYGYENVNARDIYVCTEKEAIAIQVAYVQTRPLVHPGEHWEKGRSKTDGVWGVGMIALELAYGSLPRNCNGTKQLVSMAKNLVRILKEKLGCKYSDDEDLEEEEEEEEQEEEIEERIIKLPDLEKLLDVDYVKSLVKKLVNEKKDKRKKNITAVLKKEFNRAMSIFRLKDDEIEREFSRDFLEVVLDLLDKRNWTLIDLILAHHFLRERNPIERANFESSMRGEA